jgi:hypothetical protein
LPGIFVGLTGQIHEHLENTSAKRQTHLTCWNLAQAFQRFSVPANSAEAEKWMNPFIEYYGKRATQMLTQHLDEGERGQTRKPATRCWGKRETNDWVNEAEVRQIVSEKFITFLGTAPNERRFNREAAAALASGNAKALRVALNKDALLHPHRHTNGIPPDPVFERKPRKRMGCL